MKLPPLAILAGGLASRLRSVAGDTPKALVPVAGKPFIAHQLGRVQRAGISRVVLCIGHAGEQIEQFVGDGRAFGLEVSYSYDGTELKGTGGAILNALKPLGDIFFVTYGDTLLELDYKALFLDALAHPNTAGIMAVLRNENQWDRSNVLFENSQILRYDKSGGGQMRHIDYGLSLFRARAFEGWKPCERFDLSEVVTHLLATNQLRGFEVSKRFYEIGTPAALRETETYLEKNANE